MHLKNPISDTENYNTEGKGRREKCSNKEREKVDRYSNSNETAPVEMKEIAIDE